MILPKNIVQKSLATKSTKFTLYNLAGQEKAHYLVDQVNLVINSDAIDSNAKLLDDGVTLAIEETLSSDYVYQVFFSRNAKKIKGTNQTLKILGLLPEESGIIYKYKQISSDIYQQLDVPVAQNHESVYAFARTNLSEGNLNIAKYAIASTFDATLTEKHIKALTNDELTNFAQDIEIAIFYPNVLREHEINKQVKLNQRTSLIEVIQILNQYRQNIIINIQDLQDNYQRKGIKRINGVRDENGEIIKPWLQTECIIQGEYVNMGVFAINRNTATINMLINRKIKLVKAEDKTPIVEVAGLLTNDLANFNNYTIVSDGEINVKSIQVKISNKKAFDLLKAKGVINGAEFNFHTEYTIQLDNLPLVPFDGYYSSIDGLFKQLAEIKILSSIISAYLREESDMFVKPQLDELKKHHLSKNIYLNFPKTNEYSDIQEAIVDGKIEARVSYKIDIGSQEILNLSKLHSANKFLERRYQFCNQESGEIVNNPRFNMQLNQHITVQHKPLSPRLKITKVDELMKPIFDDFLGLEENGLVTAILSKIGAVQLVQVLQAKKSGESVTKEEFIAALAIASHQLEEYVDKIYREQISPLVFYIGSTGLLPDAMVAKTMTAAELLAKYPHLQFSKHEQEGTFFVVDNSIISVYPQTEYYSQKAVKSADITHPQPSPSP